MTVHLQQFATEAFTEPTVAQTWFKQARLNLKGGRVADLIAQMQTRVEKGSGERHKSMAGQLAYFTTGQQLYSTKLRKGSSNEATNWQWGD